MDYLLICLVALLASGLTFFSGFGLGTLLLPAFALFFPLEQAIAMTAVVHLFNGLFKLVLVGRHARWQVLLRFGLPAIVAALAGAWVLTRLDDADTSLGFDLFELSLVTTPVKLVIGALLLLFSAIELLPRLRDISFPPRYLPLGGALSGFFGGLSGMQGALRSAFLVRAGLSKEAFIGTGAAIASLIDVSRLGVYWPSLAATSADLDYALLAVAMLSAFAGAFLGNRYLHKVTMPGIQRFVAALLALAALGLMTGLL